MNVFFIDYETTGLNPYYNEPIEIAIKKINSEKHFQSLIKPEINGINYQYVPQKIQEITGITDEDIVKSAKEINEVTSSLLEYIKINSDEGPIYILAHNGYLFDFIFFRKMINDYLTTEGVKTRRKSFKTMIDRFEYIDTVLVARLLLRDETVRQPSLCKKYNIINESEHRAYGDIIALEKIYKIVCEHLSYIHKKNNKNYYIDRPGEILQKTTFNLS